MIECVEYRPHASGALQGFAILWVPKWGVEIRGCSVYGKEGRRWMNVPTREYDDKESGERRYINVLNFRDDALKKAFCKMGLEAVDIWMAQMVDDEPDAIVEQDDGVPF